MPKPPLPLPARLNPVGATFIASLVLSLIAWLGSTINRDGMLYVRVGQAFIDGGFTAAREAFHWPFLGIFMGLLAKISGLSIEHAGYLINALFMAGASALMVACVQRRQPALVWLTALSVLALPGLNEYRNELLREFGAWYFGMLSLWLALRWDEKPTWLPVLVIQVCLGLAMLFRPEMACLYGALILWQLFAAPRGERLRRSAMLGALPLLGVALLTAAYLGGQIPADSRLAFDLGRINSASFDAKAELLASGLIDYARDDTRAILFFGSLALIPLKLINKFGIFLLPLGFLFLARARDQGLGRHALFTWAIAMQVLVLAIFVLDLQFLSGRYVGPILLFSVPFVAAGLHAMLARLPRWRLPILAVPLLIALTNVVSLSPSKAYLVDAGHWLTANIQEPTTVYIDSGRTAYHAGWLNLQTPTRNDRPAIAAAVADPRYHLFVLEISRHDPAPDEWLNSLGLHVVQRFEHAKGDAVIVAERRAKP